MTSPISVRLPLPCKVEVAVGPDPAPPWARPQAGRQDGSKQPEGRAQEAGRPVTGTSRSAAPLMYLQGPFYPGKQGDVRDGLGDVIEKAFLKRLGLLGLPQARREQDHRNAHGLREQPQRVEQLVAVENRHFLVGHYDVGPLANGFPEGVHPVFGG